MRVDPSKLLLGQAFSLVLARPGAFLATQGAVLLLGAVCAVGLHFLPMATRLPVVEAGTGGLAAMPLASPAQPPLVLGLVWLFVTLAYTLAVGVGIHVAHAVATGGHPGWSGVLARFRRRGASFLGASILVQGTIGAIALGLLLAVLAAETALLLALPAFVLIAFLSLAWFLAQPVSLLEERGPLETLRRSLDATRGLKLRILGNALLLSLFVGLAWLPLEYLARLFVWGPLADHLPRAAFEAALAWGSLLIEAPFMAALLLVAYAAATRQGVPLPATPAPPRPLRAHGAPGLGDPGLVDPAPAGEPGFTAMPPPRRLVPLPRNADASVAVLLADADVDRAAALVHAGHRVWCAPPTLDADGVLSAIEAGVERVLLPLGHPAQDDVDGDVLALRAAGPGPWEAPEGAALLLPDGAAAVPGRPCYVPAQDGWVRVDS